MYSIYMGLFNGKLGLIGGDVGNLWSLRKGSEVYWGVLVAKGGVQTVPPLSMQTKATHHLGLMPFKKCLPKVEANNLA